MDFTIYKVKSTQILNKSKDFLGFQDKILQQNIQNNNRNCKWSKTIPNKQFSYKFTTPTDLYKNRSLQNNTKQTLTIRSINNTDLKQLQ